MPRLELADLPPPGADTLAEPAVLHPIPAPVRVAVPEPAPAQVSIFSAGNGPSRANSGDFFEVARRMQLSAPDPVGRASARRPSRSRSLVVGAICLVVGAAVGFGAGYQLGSGDGPADAPAGVTE